MSPKLRCHSLVHQFRRGRMGERAGTDTLPSRRRLSPLPGSESSPGQRKVLEEVPPTPRGSLSPARGPRQRLLSPPRPTAPF